MPVAPTLVCSDLLATIEQHAAEADLTRSLHPDVVSALKASDLVRRSATRGLAGTEATVLQIAHELEAIAPVCGSTAWVLWNHLGVYHLVVGELGPSRQDLLHDVIANRSMVAFPGGAGTRISGEQDGDDFRLAGLGAFGTGSRYAEWMATAFVVPSPLQLDGPPDLRFTLTPTDAEGVRIDPNWDGAALRASATDDVYFEDVTIPAQRVVRFQPRSGLRDPAREMIAPRYREDWVALSVLWLGAMAAGVAQAALDDAAASIRDRFAVGGTRMTELPIAHANLGQARAQIDAARASFEAGCRETDARIEACGVPSEADYLRQMSLGMIAVELCETAMGLVQRVLGGNGLRESGRFHCLFRDFQAAPLHIIVHRDRVSEALGRNLLGLEPTNRF